MKKKRSALEEDRRNVCGWVYGSGTLRDGICLSLITTNSGKSALCVCVCGGREGRGVIGW